MTITEQLAEALGRLRKTIAAYDRVHLELDQGKPWDQDVSYETWLAYTNQRITNEARSTLAAYEASKAAPAHELTCVNWRELHSDLLSLTDNSNWDIDGIKGTYFQGYSAAMEILHDWLHDNWPAPAQGQDIEGLVERCQKADRFFNHHGPVVDARLLDEAVAALLAVQQKLRGGE